MLIMLALTITRKLADSSQYNKGIDCSEIVRKLFGDCSEIVRRFRNTAHMSISNALRYKENIKIIHQKMFHKITQKLNLHDLLSKCKHCIQYTLYNIISYH